MPVMEDVMVTSFSLSGHGGDAGLPRAAGDDAPTESVSFNFGQAGVDYFGGAASADGSRAEPGTILTGDAPAAEGKIGPFMGVLSDYPTSKAPDDAFPLNFEALANVDPASAGQSSGLGDTGTHEVGHWMGLYHTFETSGRPGDAVFATEHESYGVVNLISDTGGQLGPLFDFDLV